MISPRDVVVFAQVIKEEDGTIYIIGKSIVDPSIPEAKGYVRAEVQLYAWILTPWSSDKNKTTCIRMLLTDPKGSLPKMIVNKVSKNEALVVSNLRQVAEKRNNKK